METIKLFDKTKDGFSKIAVPKNFENKELEIDVKIVEVDNKDKTDLADVEKRGKALFARFGKAKFKDYTIRIDDNYYQ